MRTALVLGLVVAMALTLFATAAVPARADHQSTPWSNLDTVTSSGTNSEQYPQVLADGNGNVYAFYVDYTGAVANVLVEKFAQLGPSGTLTMIRGPVQVNDVANVVYSGAHPSAAIDHSGNLYVAWTSVQMGTSSFNVFLSKSSDGGATWHAAKEVDPGTTAVQDYTPAVAVTPSGTVYVVWDQLWGTGARDAVVASSSDGGVTFGDYHNITVASPGSPWLDYYPGLQIDSAGRLYVVSGQELASGTSVVNFTWSADGTAWSTPVTLNAGGSNGVSPTLAVDAQGTVHAVWADSRVGPSGVPLVYYRRSTDHGATWSVQTPISSGFTSPFITGVFADVQVKSEGDTVLVTWGVSSGGFLGYVVSADHGVTWYSENLWLFSSSVSVPTLSVDPNGTFYMAATAAGTPSQIGISWWHSPPSAVSITSTESSGNSLTVSWTAASEPDVVSYRIWRSPDGSNYNVVAVVNAPETSFTDSGLANGTYWYQVQAVDEFGSLSHASVPMSGTVGQTTAQLIASLQSQIAALKSQIAALQNSQTANAAQLAALQGNLTKLQQQLSDLQNAQSQQATQTISYANLAFEIIVVVLLVVLLLNQMRKPKSPQMMMAQPATVEPRKPEDDL